jgi:hypothetical protein
MASLVTLCNQALAEIAKGAVVSLDEGSLEANECQRFAQPLLEEMVDWSDSFPFARTRGALALTTNDRPAEWLYAYAAPTDLGAPLAIRAVEDAATALPVSGPFTFPFQDDETLAYLSEGGRIYSNVENATLVYSRSTLEAGDLPPLGQRAFVLELAARISTPLTKDAKLAQAVAQRAEIARLRFIADEENKDPRPAPRYVSEAEWARAGYGV